MWLSIFEICSDRNLSFIMFLNERGYEVVNWYVAVKKDPTNFITVVTKNPLTDNGDDAFVDIEGFFFDDFEWFVSSIYTD